MPTYLSFLNDYTVNLLGINLGYNRNKLHLGPNRSDLHLYVLVYDDASYYRIVMAVLNG